MFTSYEQLEKRSGKKGIDRPDYLKELVDEFTTSENLEAREQVLANLANFAYDPINYKWFRKLKVIDIFLNQITEGTSTLQGFAASGICNIVLDRECKAYIIQNGGIALMYDCLSAEEESVVISAITSLMYLVTPETKAEITSAKVIKQMVAKANSDNPRIRNLAKVFLADYCSSEEVEKITSES